MCREHAFPARGLGELVQLVSSKPPLLHRLLHHRLPRTLRFLAFDFEW